MLLRKLATTVALPTMIAALGLACSSSGDTDSALSAQSRDNGDGSTGAMGGESPQGDAEARRAPRFDRNDCSDAQSAAIVVAANQGELLVSRLGVERGQNPEVVRFARRMVEEHTALGEQAAQLLTRLGVTPEPNDTSRALEAQARAELSELEELSAEEFDRRFMATQLIFHLKVLGHLDELLIPSARNATYRATLRTARGHVAVHARQAFEVQATLSGRCGSRSADDAGAAQDGGASTDDAGPGPAPNDGGVGDSGNGKSDEECEEDAGVLGPLGDGGDDAP
jgi:putative membrane protein